MKGDLLYRPPRGGGQWLIRNVEIEGDHINIQKSEDEINENSSTIDDIEIVELDPTCSVFETNLGPHAFEVVTPKKILHFISESKEMTSIWIAAIRETIFNCTINFEDPFIKAITERIELDKYYEVEFRENKPLGVVLERSNESAVVKMSNFKVRL